MAKRGGRRPTPEKQWQGKVQNLLHAHGYVVDHSYPLPTRDGSWRTGSTWTGKPDILAVRPPRILAIECKADRHYKPTPEQVASLSLWALVPCARAWLLLPDTVPWPDLRTWVAHPGKAPAVVGFTPMDQLAAYRVLATATQRTTR